VEDRDLSWCPMRYSSPIAPRACADRRSGQASGTLGC
jgi:hypothetical protein